MTGSDEDARPNGIAAAEDCLLGVSSRPCWVRAPRHRILGPIRDGFVLPPVSALPGRVPDPVAVAMPYTGVTLKSEQEPGKMILIARAACLIRGGEPGLRTLPAAAFGSEAG
jgi:hypothetical protein